MKLAKMNKYKPEWAQYEEDNKNLLDNLIIEYMDIAQNIYVYENLPESVSSYIIERSLFWCGKCVFFYDDNLGYLALPPITYKYINVYGLPQQYGAQGMNGDTFLNLSPENSVLMKNTPNYVPTRLGVERLCEELVNVYRARTINVNANKTPFVFSGDEKELLTLKNVYKQISGNDTIIYRNKGSIQQTDLNVLNTQATFIADKLTALKNDIKCELLTYLGLNNTNIEKKERLVTDEVNSNNDLIENYLFMRFYERKKAVDSINTMFGLNIAVRLNKDYLKQFGINVSEDKEKSESDSNE